MIEQQVGTVGVEGLSAKQRDAPITPNTVCVDSEHCHR